MSTSPITASRPVGGAAITATVVGFFAVALLGVVVTLLFEIGLWRGMEPTSRIDAAGPLLVAAIGLGASACAWGIALLIRRKIEWVGGAPLAVLGAVFGAIAVVGSLVFFVLFVGRSAARAPAVPGHSTTSTSAGPIVR
jgi:hypothetical protein